MPSLSVRRALWIGWLWVNLPVFVLLFGPMAILLLTVGNDQIGVPLGVATLVLSFAGAWLWWSVMIPRWRLWSYRRVENPLALKHAAVDAQLTWREGSSFARTEIKSAHHAEMERRLERQALADHGPYQPAPQKEETLDEKASAFLIVFLPIAAFLIGGVLYERHYGAAESARANTGLLLVGVVCIGMPFLYRRLGVRLAGWRRLLFPVASILGVGALLVADYSVIRTSAGRAAVVAGALVVLGGTLRAYVLRR